MNYEYLLSAWLIDNVLTDSNTENSASLNIPEFSFYFLNCAPDAHSRLDVKLLKQHHQHLQLSGT